MISRPMTTVVPEGRGGRLRLSVWWLTLLGLTGLLSTPDLAIATPILTFTKSAPATVAPFANLTYTFTLGNTGDTDAIEVVIQDTIPAGTTFVSATGGGTLINTFVNWNIPLVPPGSTGLTVSFTVRVMATSGTVDNLSYSIAELNTAPVAGPPVSTLIVTPGLTLTKSAPTTVATGKNLTYTITYGNTAVVAAPSVSIADTIPAGTTFVSATNGGSVVNGVVTWNIGTVPAGSSGLTVSFTVLVPATSGTVNNLVYTIQSAGLPPVAGPPVSTQISNLTITKSAPPTVATGADLTYTINYGNVGLMPIGGVVITDRIPVGTTFVSATGGGTPNNGVVSWNIGTAPAPTKATVSFTVHVDATSGTVDNATYTISGSAMPPVAGPPVSTQICNTPVAVATASPTSICPGASATLHGSGGDSCAWSPATWLSNPNACNTTVTPTASGSVTYTLTVKNAACAVQSTNKPTVTITATSQPDGPLVNAPAKAAAGQAGLVASIVNPKPRNTYAWTFDPPNSAAVTSQGASSITFTALSVPLVLSVTENVGACVSNPTVVVIEATPVCVNPQPPPSALIQAAGNPDGPVTGIDYLNLSWTAPEIPPLLYLWSLNGALPQEETTTSVPNQPPTGNNNSITLQVRAACSASVFSDATTYTVSPSPPGARFSVTPSVGAGMPVTFTDTSDPDATSWLWLFGDGTDASTNQSVTHTFASVGTYTVFLIASNGAGSGSASQQIEVTSDAVPAARLATETSPFDASHPERQRLNAIDLSGAGHRWLRVQSQEQTETILFLRFLDPTGALVLERRLSVSPEQDAAFDLTAYGLEGSYDLELVSLRPVTASIVQPPDRKPREVRR